MANVLRALNRIEQDGKTFAPGEVVDNGSDEDRLWLADNDAAVWADSSLPATSLLTSTLTEMTEAQLLQVAIDEGVIDDVISFRQYLIDTIEAKRAAAGKDDNPDIDEDDLGALVDEARNPIDVQEGDLAAEIAAGGQPLVFNEERTSEADGVEKIAIPAELDGSGSFVGEADLDGDGDLPQLDHDGDGAPGGSLPKDPPGLTGKNKTELLAIAEAEGAEADSGMSNKQIVAAIEAGRAAAGDDEAPVE